MKKVDGEDEEEGRGRRREVTLFYFIFWRVPRHETQREESRENRRRERERHYEDREIPFPILLFSFHFVLAFSPVGSIPSHPAWYIVIHKTAYTHTFKNNHTVEYSKREIKKMNRQRSGLSWSSHTRLQSALLSISCLLLWRVCIPWMQTRLGPEYGGVEDM